MIFALSFKLYGQCNESDATLEETQTFIKQTIEAYGGDPFPKTKYEVSFRGSAMDLTVFSIVMGEADTASIYTIDLKVLDLDNLKYEPKKEDFFLTLGTTNNTAVLHDLTTDLKLNVALKIRIKEVGSKKDLFNRLEKAFRHAKCLSGGILETNSKF